jgi:hypothetical protein
VSFYSTCCRHTSSFATLSRAAARNAGARMRSMGLLPAKVDWATRAGVCARCPLLVVRGQTSYCGRPFLEKIDRDAELDGCGCPVRAKAQDPAEHCPLTVANRKSTRVGAACDCKWCAAHA